MSGECTSLILLDFGRQAITALQKKVANAFFFVLILSFHITVLFLTPDAIVLVQKTGSFCDKCLPGVEMFIKEFFNRTIFDQYAEFFVDGWHMFGKGRVFANGHMKCLCGHGRIQNGNGILALQKSAVDKCCE